MRPKVTAGSVWQSKAVHLRVARKQRERVKGKGGEGRTGDRDIWDKI
jgi:hypothetical protein